MEKRCGWASGSPRGRDPQSGAVRDTRGVGGSRILGTPRVDQRHERQCGAAGLERSRVGAPSGGGSCAGLCRARVGAHRDGTPERLGGSHASPSTGVLEPTWARHAWLGVPRGSVPHVGAGTPERAAVRHPRAARGRAGAQADASPRAAAPRGSAPPAAPTHPSAHGAAVAPRTLVGGGGGGDGGEKPSGLRLPPNPPPGPPFPPPPPPPTRTAPPLRAPPRGRGGNGGCGHAWGRRCEQRGVGGGR